MRNCSDPSTPLGSSRQSRSQTLVMLIKGGSVSTFPLFNYKHDDVVSFACRIMNTNTVSRAAWTAKLTGISELCSGRMLSRGRHRHGVPTAPRICTPVAITHDMPPCHDKG